MSKTFTVRYSLEALDDLRNIYSYIANDLLVPDIAEGQINSIREKIRSLDFMPTRYTLVEWEPWQSIGIRQFPVGNFIVYYLVNNEEDIVSITRIFYGGRDIQGIINSNE